MSVDATDSNGGGGGSLWLCLVPSALLVEAEDLLTDERLEEDDTSQIVILAGQPISSTLSFNELLFYISTWNGSLRVTRNAVKLDPTLLQKCGYAGLILSAEKNEVDMLRYLITEIGDSAKINGICRMCVMLCGRMDTSLCEGIIRYLALEVIGPYIKLVYELVEDNRTISMHHAVYPDQIQALSAVDELWCEAPLAPFILDEIHIYDDTPLHLATYRGNVEAVRFLIRNEFVVDKQNACGATCLQISVDMLITQCTINGGDEDLQSRYYDICKLLIDSGAHLDVASDKGSCNNLYKTLKAEANVHHLLSRLVTYIRAQYPLRLSCLATQVIVKNNLSDPLKDSSLPQQIQRFMAIHTKPATALSPSTIRLTEYHELRLSSRRHLAADPVHFHVQTAAMGRTTAAALFGRANSCIVTLVVVFTVLNSMALLTVGVVYFAQALTYGLYEVIDDRDSLMATAPIVLVSTLWAGLLLLVILADNAQQQQPYELQQQQQQQRAGFLRFHREFIDA